MLNYYQKKNIFIIFFVLILIAGCSKDERGFDNVSLRLKWVFQSQFAGAFAAKEEGFFKKAKMQVTINPGGIDFNPIKLVASGSDQFAITSADQVLLAKAKRIPIKAVAMIFQDDPIVFFSLKEKGILHPKDFIGKVVGVKYGYNNEVEYRAMLRKFGIDQKQIKEIPIKVDLSPLFTGQVDIFTGYISNEPLVAIEKGYEINIIRPQDYGIKMYADCLITTDEIIKNNPDLVRKFIKAFFEGWQWVVENPEKAVDCVLKVNPSLDKVHERKMLKKIIELMTGGDATKHGMGYMSYEGWLATYNLLAESGLIESPFDPRDAFTTEFIEYNK